MFLKIVVAILSIGLTAAGLLALRQLRLQAVHESAVVERRIAEHDRLLWKLRGDIAMHITPEHVRAMAGRLGPMAYLNEDRKPKPVLAMPDDTAIVGTPASQTPKVPGDADPVDHR
ncbi:MAG: hypothetical protein H7210_09880 [Pyrinomonadaceae bacterium]|nr:hypothetical protein [Phycisphaerales bacterium]